MTIGGLKKTSSPLALVAAAGFLMGGMALTPAMAADLGGDCCADLEERVAELEATTARKGNRKVSLTISGHVARDFGWYEDEYGDSEFYSTGHGPSGSRIQFAGSAALTSSWTAGYTLRFRIDQDRNSSSLKFAGNNGAHGRGGKFPRTDRNFVYLKNDRLGTFVLGQAAAPTGGIAAISLGGHGVVTDAGGDSWNGSRIQGFNLEQDISHQAVAWISPTVRGFTFAVAWSDLNVDTHNTTGSFAGAAPVVGGHDDAVDAWDMALRYAQEFGPVRIAAGIGYTTVDNDEVIGSGANVMGSLALIHTPTGLNLAFAAGTEVDGGLPGIGAAGVSGGRYVAAGGLATGTGNDFGPGAGDANFWHIEGGVNRDFTGFGKTAIYAEYGFYDYDNVTALDDTVEMWGLGVVQNFDKAATELYLAYRHWDQNLAAANPNGDLADGDVDQVMAGMRIKF